MSDPTRTRPDTVHVRLPGPLVEARFVERPNRFLLRCSLPPDVRRSGREPGLAFTSPESAGDGTPTSITSLEAGGGDVVDVHMADPGRLKELLLPGKRVWIRHAASPTRKTEWSAVLVESPAGDGLVSLDTTLPNRLIHRALAAGVLGELAGWELERAEFPLGASRIDFLLRRPTVQRPRAGGAGGRAPAGGEPKLALEVKSVTLVEDGVALFPDAVTARGTRHVRELAGIAGSVDASGSRWEAAILFVLQRADATRIEAARSIDAGFADALAEAKAAGVRVLGRRCRVSRDRLALGGPVPAG